MKTTLPGTACPLHWERLGGDDPDMAGLLAVAPPTRVAAPRVLVVDHDATFAPGGGYPLWPLTVAGDRLHTLFEHFGERALVVAPPEVVEGLWPWHRGADRPGDNE